MCACGQDEGCSKSGGDSPDTEAALRDDVNIEHSGLETEGRITGALFLEVFGRTGFSRRDRSEKWHSQQHCGL